jgi:hypothetical protein
MDEEDPPRTQIYMRPRDALKRLSAAGLIHGLDEANLDALRRECWDDDEDQMEEVGTLGILTMFYESIEKGRADGFYWRDDQFWNQTEDVVAELSAVLAPKLGDAPPIFKQQSVSEKLSTEKRKETVHVLEVLRDDGQTQEIEARSLDDVVAAFNTELKARGQTLRIVPLDTSDEWRMYVAMELPLARQLAREGALPVEDMAGLVD